MLVFRGKVLIMVSLSGKYLTHLTMIDYPDPGALIGNPVNKYIEFFPDGRFFHARKAVDEGSYVLQLEKWEQQKNEFPTCCGWYTYDGTMLNLDFASGSHQSYRLQRTPQGGLMADGKPWGRLDSPRDDRPPWQRG
jgi:hypothetical protein